MKKFLTVHILILATIMLFCRVACATFNETKVRDFLNTTGEKFIETLGLQDLGRKYTILDDMFETKFDTKAMGRFVLGANYRLLNDAQKEQYQALFKRYIKSLYKSYPLDFKTDEIKFRVTQITKNNKYVFSAVIVDLPEKYQTEKLKAVRLEFRLKETENGDYVISDVSIADVSMLVSLKPRFTQMFKDAADEPEWFLEDFEDLVVSNEQQVAELL